MADLTYKIGGLNISEGGLKLSGHQITIYTLIQRDKGRFLARHFYLVERKKEEIAIYVSGKVTRHAQVAGHFNLEDNDIVGGGNCYIDLEGRLTIDDFSGDYGTIPKEVAHRFAELLITELKGKEDIRGIVANPNEEKLNGYWKDKRS